jgi:hypothetical protein
VILSRSSFFRRRRSFSNKCVRPSISFIHQQIPKTNTHDERRRQHPQCQRREDKDRPNKRTTFAFSFSFTSFPHPSKEYILSKNNRNDLLLLTFSKIFSSSKQKKCLLLPDHLPCWHPVPPSVVGMFCSCVCYRQTPPQKGVAVSSLIICVNDFGGGVTFYPCC